tara:strand:- start:414 stop:524 length:111 start_codon:yes stop_codon:yes gene_type:complete
MISLPGFVEEWARYIIKLDVFSTPSFPLENKNDTVN